MRSSPGDVDSVVDPPVFNVKPDGDQVAVSVGAAWDTESDGVADGEREGISGTFVVIDPRVSLQVVAENECDRVVNRVCLSHNNVNEAVPDGVAVGVGARVGADVLLLFDQSESQPQTPTQAPQADTMP